MGLRGSHFGVAILLVTGICRVSVGTVVYVELVLVLRICRVSVGTVVYVELVLVLSYM